jgi:hypothetical protein
MLGAGGHAALSEVPAPPQGGGGKHTFYFFKVFWPPAGCMRPREVACGNNFLFLFYFFFHSQATSRSAAWPPAPSGKIKLKFIFFKLKFFSSFGLNPADVRGVQPWEPPHLQPPNSYLLHPTSYLLPPTSTTI